MQMGLDGLREELAENKTIQVFAEVSTSVFGWVSEKHDLLVMVCFNVFLLLLLLEPVADTRNTLKTASTCGSL